jgi:hypothetical protein
VAGGQTEGVFKSKQCRENLKRNVDALVKSRKYPFFVIPAKVGIQYFRALAEYLDSGWSLSRT